MNSSQSHLPRPVCAAICALVLTAAAVGNSLAQDTKKPNIVLRTGHTKDSEAASRIAARRGYVTCHVGKWNITPDPTLFVTEAYAVMNYQNRSKEFPERVSAIAKAQREARRRRIEQRKSNDALQINCSIGWAPSTPTSFWSSPP